MAGELCAVLLQAVYLTLDGTTVIGVLLILCTIKLQALSVILSSIRKQIGIIKTTRH